MAKRGSRPYAGVNRIRLSGSSHTANSQPLAGLPSDSPNVELPGRDVNDCLGHPEPARLVT